MDHPMIEDPAYWYSDAYLDYTDQELAIEYAEFIETDRAMSEIIHESQRRGLTLNDLEQIYLETINASQILLNCTCDTDDPCDPSLSCGTTA